MKKLEIYEGYEVTGATLITPDGEVTRYTTEELRILFENIENSGKEQSCESTSTPSDKSEH